MQSLFLRKSHIPHGDWKSDSLLYGERGKICIIWDYTLFLHTHKHQNLTNHFERKYCLFAFYVMTPDPAIQTRTVCKYSVCCVLITNIIFIFDQLFQSDCHSFTLRKLYICLETFLCFFGST